MSKEEIIQLTIETREAQKKYFSERTRTNLDNSVKLEKKLDKELLPFIKKPAVQQALF